MSEVMWVTVAVDGDTSEVNSISHTVEEIISAYENGKVVIFKLSIQDYLFITLNITAVIPLEKVVTATCLMNYNEYMTHYELRIDGDYVVLELGVIQNIAYANEVTE